MARDQALPRTVLDGVLLSLLVALLPHALHLPAWLILLALAAVAWRYWASRHDLSDPSWLLRISLTGVLFTIIYVDFGGLREPRTGVALLVGMMSMKLLETRGRRDAMLLLLLSYLLIGTLCLFDQHLALAMYALAAILWITATLLQAALNGRTLPWLDALGQAALLIGQALPIMLALFLLFPRLSGPLWQMPRADGEGQTGMSDHLEPGSISALNLSSALAFRVRFLDAPPPAGTLYWRGPVLWRFDGRSWTADPAPVRPEPFAPTLQGRSVRYEIMLEPHGQHWLFALDLPVRTNRPDARWLDGQLLADQPIDARLHYQALSYPNYRLDPQLSAADRQRALALPASGNPRALAQAHQWRAHGLTDWQIIQQALAQFREQPFFYTLHPPELNGNIIDDFLFHSRRGFCEHYASAFAFLMRAAGIPARIVLGYQGGEPNPLSDHYRISQADAHAWTEVWLAETGWLRIDPTAAIAPGRIDADAQLATAVAARHDGWLHGLALGWDALDYRWEDWVLDYGRTHQQQMLSGLTVDGLASRGSILLTSAMGLAVLMLMYTRRWPRRQPRASVSLQYHRFCALLASLDLARAPHEGPIDYGRRCAQRHPELAPLINQFIQLYIRQRYQSQSQTEPQDQMRTLLRRLRWILLRRQLAERCTRLSCAFRS